MIRSHARQRTTPWTAGIGPSFTIRARKALCVSSSLGGTPGEGILMRPSGPLLVEPDHPIPQCLTIHPADLRRVFPRGAVKHSRDRQQSSRLRGILCAFRKLANLAGRIVPPNRNCLAHGKHPPFATLNHAARDSEIPHESAARRVGIRAQNEQASASRCAARAVRTKQSNTASVKGFERNA